jgi:hypothetical protein
VGNRVGERWMDVIHIAGFSRGCVAWRKRTSSLVVPGNGLIARRVEGSALAVLNDVLSWETES